MNALVFVSVMSRPNNFDNNFSPSQPNQRNRCILSGNATFQLRLDDRGHLAGERVENQELLPDVVDRDSSVVAYLNIASERATPSRMLIARSHRVGLNGQTPTLPIAAVEPGDLISIGEQSWMVSSLWQPEPIDAPADLRDKPCPVCGGELSVARVVQCSCGRWSHLENPDAPDDPSALNCFLKAGACGECGRGASLEPQMIPDVPDSLIATQLEGEE